MVEGITVFKGGVEDEVGVPLRQFDVGVEEENGMVRGNAVEGGDELGGAGERVEVSVNRALDGDAGARREVVGMEEIPSEGVNGDGGVQDDSDTGWTVGFRRVVCGGDGPEKAFKIPCVLVGVDDDLKGRDMPGCRMRCESARNRGIKR